MGAGLILAIALAGAIPANAVPLVPVLVEEQREHWPRMPQPWTLAGLVEQESCITLRHSRCWRPNAELKTAREYGFGLGQITVAYHADGRTRFNKFEELRTGHASLGGWAWEERFDARMQLRAIVLMNLEIWRRLAPAATVEDHLSFMLSSYNGGVAGLTQDRRLCGNTRGCDQSRWFGHVELHSTKSRRPQPGYGGRSWYEINRSHVRNVMKVRRQKYRTYWSSP